MKIESPLKIESLFLIVVGSLLLSVYYPGFGGPFLLDDFGNIVNAKVEKLNFEEVARVVTSNTSGMFGRPVSAITLALNYLINGDNPFGYKLFNWILHLVNTCLVYFLAFMLFGAARNDSDVKSNDVLETKFVAVFVALIWALHPLQVSTVLYVVQRMAQLSTLFILLALLVYLHGRRRYVSSGKGIYSMSFGFSVFGVLACLSKENGALLPIYVLGIELIVFKCSFIKGNICRGIKGFVMMFVCVPIVIGSIAIMVLFGRLTAGYSQYSNNGLTLLERLLTEPVVIFGYLQAILIPDINSMSLYQDFWKIQAELSPEVMVSVLVLSGLVAFAFFLRRSLPLVSLGVFVFFTSHGLESTFIPLALAFEHRNYFGTIGIAIAIGSLILQLKNHGNSNSGIPLLVAVVLVFGLAFQTHSRSIEWSDEFTLNSFAVDNFPDSFSARTWYAISLSKRGEVAKAIEQLDIAKTIKPEYAYPEVAKLQMNCLLGESIEEHYSLAVDEISTKIIDVTSLSVVLNTVENSKKGYCSGLSQNDISLLLAGAYHNTRTSLAGRMELILGFEYSSSLIRNGKIKDAKEVVLSMLERYPHHAISLILFGRIQGIENDIIGLEGTLDLLDTLSFRDKSKYALQLEQLRAKYSILTE